MFPIGASPNGYEMLSGGQEYQYIPFQTLVFETGVTRSQYDKLESQLAGQCSLQGASTGSMHQSHLDLSDMGLVHIYSWAGLSWGVTSSVSLDNNPCLSQLPDDFPSGLKQLSLRHNPRLRWLPSLPDGLSVDITGSGITHEYLQLWNSKFPLSGVSFFDNGTAVLPADSYLPVPFNATRERGNFEANLVRSEQQAAMPSSVAPSFPVDQYQTQVSVQSVSPDVFSGEQLIQAMEDEHLEAPSMLWQGSWSQQQGEASGYQSRPLRLDNYLQQRYRPHHADSGWMSGQMGGHYSAAGNEDNGATRAGFDSHAELDKLTQSGQWEGLTELGQTRLPASQYSPPRSRSPALADLAPTEDPKPGLAGYARAMEGCLTRMRMKMNFWLHTQIDHPEEVATMASRYASHLYALEEEDAAGVKRRSQAVIVAEHSARFDEFGEHLDAIKKTASFQEGSKAARERQSGRVAEFLQLMTADKDLCSVIMEALKEAASTCPDALATEGLDMIEALCTTQRSIQEDWTPEVFYEKMIDRIKRDEIRTQVGDIAIRMEKEYGAAIQKAIAADHDEIKSLLFPRLGKNLYRLTGERHYVMRNGDISVLHRKEEVGRISMKKSGAAMYRTQMLLAKIDNIEILAYCENTMAKRGHLDEVQDSLYARLHQENEYSDLLNVKKSELERMEKSMDIPHALVLRKMTMWDPWTAYLDRNGYMDKVGQECVQSPEQKELRTSMERHQKKLEEFIDKYAMDHADAGQDFALLNNLIIAIGTPVVPPHEILRRGGKGADAIDSAQKEKYLAEGKARLSELEEAASKKAKKMAKKAAQEEVAQKAAAKKAAEEATRKSSAGSRHGSDHRRHRSGHGNNHGSSSRSEHKSSRRETGESSSHRDAGQPVGKTVESAQEPVKGFDDIRLDLFRSALKRLGKQKDSPFESALLRKTTELVELYQAD